MLIQSIGDLLPSAVGVAISPIPIIAIVLMLATPRARSNGVAFALGWIAGLSAVVAVVLLVAKGAGSGTTDDGVDWATLAFGLVFLGLARRQWSSRPEKGEEPKMPGWMEAVDHFTFPRSLGLGLVLSAANPKNFVLTAAAAGAIAKADMPVGDEIVAAVVFVVIASVTVVGLVLFYLVAPTAAARSLDAIKEFMAHNNAVIMTVLFLILGAKLIGNGLGGAFG
ncbi:GAP family protein [Dermatobacter hominis]|uniref:GAP family protein n=1 Tax=Dermatobacter hominis TaxID=2884263 RepID=UPI001D12404F|nr:GAP family protein [Dermatobacter hominis]UDY34479.1 GAP family protein [Dermatobacter hominis]